MILPQRYGRAHSWGELAPPLLPSYRGLFMGPAEEAAWSLAGYTDYLKPGSQAWVPTVYRGCLEKVPQIPRGKHLGKSGWKKPLSHGELSLGAALLLGEWVWGSLLSVQGLRALHVTAQPSEECLLFSTYQPPSLLRASALLPQALCRYGQ